MKTIAISSNSGWNIVNFRAGLIRKLIDYGFKVNVIVPDDAYRLRICELGAEIYSIDLKSSGLSPIRDISSFLAYLKILRDLRPDAYLGFTVKPNIYGSLAAHLLGIKVINNISGLGTVFGRNGVLRLFVEGLYRLALRPSASIFFQNPDDLALFTERRLVKEGQAKLLPGSGVDLSRFSPPPGDREPGPFRFLMVGRMLWDKGVGQYVEAARNLRQRLDRPAFSLLGPAGVDNPGAISGTQLNQWSAEGNVTYLGESDDVRPHVAKADCVVLPSYYREGIPRTLIEAAAMGKPIITTDEVGCREAVEHGRTGFLCRSRSVDSLVEAMERILSLDAAALAEMGAEARRKAERQFDERLIAEAYIAALQD